MSPTALATHTAQFMDIARQFIRLRRRFKAVMPKDVAEARARFEQSFAEERVGSGADYDLFYNIAIILSRRQEPMTMGELSQALDVPLSTATRLVDLLVKSGYVRRLPDAEDRRVVRVALTETGQGMCDVIDKFIRKRVDKLLRGFTPQEREDLLRLLGKLVRALGEEA